MKKNIILLLCIFLIIYVAEKIFSKEVVLIQSNDIFLEYNIENDLSIFWELPQSLMQVNTINMFIEYEIITINNNKYGMFLSMLDRRRNTIRPEDIIKALVRAYPENPKYLRGKITKYYNDWAEKEEWIFNIDISDIQVIIFGNEMKPGIFKRFVGQWVPETISLDEGQYFKKNAYYLISSYEDINKAIERKKYIEMITGSEYKLNLVSYAIFKVEKDTSIINNENGDLNLNSGGLNLDEIRIREIIISGNNNDGFTLFVTPESTNIFIVKEGSNPRSNY